MTVRSERNDDGILVVTLDRPQVMNALDVPSKERLGEIWREAAAERAVRAIVLRGAGAKAFCAGSDIKEIRRTGKMVTTETLMNAIPGVGVALDKPVVAALHGFTVGFGLTLAIHCDFRVAAPSSKMGFPEVVHGMLSGVSAITLPGIVGEPAALDLMLTGRLIDAQEALQIRLVNRLADDPFQAAMELAKQLAANSPKAVALTKGLVLADRKRRIREIALEINRARLAVTESEEYAEVVQNKPGTGRAR